MGARPSAWKVFHCRVNLSAISLLAPLEGVIVGGAAIPGQILRCVCEPLEVWVWSMQWRAESSPNMLLPTLAELALLSSALRYRSVMGRAGAETTRVADLEGATSCGCQRSLRKHLRDVGTLFVVLDAARAASVQNECPAPEDTMGRNRIGRSTRHPCCRFRSPGRVTHRTCVHEPISLG